MKAFVMKSLGQVGFMEKPIPRPDPDEAIVKTTKALICLTVRSFSGQFARIAPPEGVFRAKIGTMAP